MAAFERDGSQAAMRSAQAAVPSLAHHYMPGAGGIVAMEGYHAGSVRTLLYQAADTVVQPWGITVGEVTAVRSWGRRLV